ncbi:MAG: hypothetical protein ACT4P3_12795 [Betaproteobacteria bacterium]
MNAFLADFLALDFDRDDPAPLLERHRARRASPRIDEARQSIAAALPEPGRSLLGWLRR